MKDSLADAIHTETPLKSLIEKADAVVVGAGSGLSTAAGYTYCGERFQYYFADFIEKYGIRDMYSGGFYPFPDMETFWGWWSRHIWLNRYAPIPNDTYDLLLNAVKGKDYFVITTNVDHCFQRAGFDKTRLFYTQGDYGLLQSYNPHGASKHKTYDNEDIVRKMLIAQGFEIDEKNNLIIPEGTILKMKVPSDMVPYCPDDGELMTTNLRADNTFVEDAGWHEASQRYKKFLNDHEDKKVLFMELGVGMNTPVIIKYPFWRMTKAWKDSAYACLNINEAYAPDEIRDRSVCISGDIRKILQEN